MHKKPLQNPSVRASMLAVCLAGVAFMAGCRAKLAPVATAPLSVEAVKSQARSKQIQQYITKRRTQARKAIKTHTVH